MSQSQPAAANGEQPPPPRVPQVGAGEGQTPETAGELADKLIEIQEKAEYRLERGGRDDPFEGLHDKSASLTLLTETDLAKRELGLEIERDLLAMEMPRNGSPWAGEHRAHLMGDERDKMEAPSEVALMRNYRIARDRARQSRSGGTLLKRLTQVLSIQEVRDKRNEGKSSWWKRLFPGGGG